jgi:hypothetical protein
MLTTILSNNLSASSNCTHLSISNMDEGDRLSASNVGDYIDLPQIVVVGDQSSGKSSVLEGLTDLSFPQDSGLCTRFATLTFQRSHVFDCTTCDRHYGSERALQQHLGDSPVHGALQCWLSCPTAYAMSNLVPFATHIRLPIACWNSA